MFDLFIGDLYYKSLLKTYHKTSSLMSLILIFLSAFSVWSGYLFLELFLGIGSGGVAPLGISTTLSILDMETLTIYHKYLPILFSLIFSIYSLGISDRFFLNIAKVCFYYLSLDEIYFKLLTEDKWISLGVVTSLIDRGILEAFGPQTQYLYLTHISTYSKQLSISGVLGQLVSILGVVWILVSIYILPFL
jgi:hypothetical protein